MKAVNVTENVKVNIPNDLKAKFIDKRWGESDMDGGIAVSVITGNIDNYSNDHILSMLGISYYYGGVGQYFENKPSIRRSKSRVLITQQWGYDC